MRMANVGLVLEVFAFVCFVLAAVPIGSPHWNRLVGAGLAFWVAAEIFGGAVRIGYLPH
jgi:hypothetical protein